MKMRDDLSYEEAARALTYCPQSGEFTWNHRPDVPTTWNIRFAGKSAGGRSKEGYRRIGINGKPYQGHRIAWLLTHGAWPSGEVDHINMDRFDNRLANLRDVSRAENARNRKAYSNNPVGLKGAFYSKRDRLWRSQIMKNRVLHYLGTFPNAEAAHAAYCRAATELHGASARFG